MARKETQQVHNPLKCQDTLYISRFSVGFFGDWTLQSIILEQSWVRSSAGGSWLSAGGHRTTADTAKGKAARPLSFWWLHVAMEMYVLVQLSPPSFPSIFSPYLHYFS